MTAAPTVIAVENVSHAYGSLEALREVSFTVAAGEVFALVGPSGCGKSTLLSIVGGLLQPTEGRVAIAGPRTDGRNPLTFIFQDFALLPWRTARDNVALPLERRGLAAAEIREVVDDALARTGLVDFAEALPKQLSGGMRQRVGIARALAVRPTILLMDEPLSALDSQTREILMDDLTRLLGGTQMSAVYVTHNLDEAVRLADRIAVFSRRPGRIREVVAIDIPRGRRTGEAALNEIAHRQRALWSLIRQEALDAERELADA
jgi:NitT/TauT family transport system ATP-binding protein